MTMKSITIQVDSAAARAYETASPEERQKLDTWLSLQLTEATRPVCPLEEVMDEISARAQARGLTPEILEDILNGP